ncbi:hypothetical protein Tco_0247552, partial [Tanacetum coccineum]
VMAAPTIPVSVDSFEGSSKDTIDIGVDVIHPVPVTSVVFPAATVVRTLARHGKVIRGIQERLLEMPTQRLEEIEEELMALRERANRAETEGVTCALELDHWRLLRHGFMA